ncbi:MAG: ribonuclease P protein component [Pseudomonadota bacterium]
MKRRADFVACRKGVRVSRECFGIQLRKREAGEDMGPAEKPHHLRVGFTVTKKIGNAVKRNRIKRRLRAASAQLDMPAALAGHDVVFMANEPAYDAPFTDITKQMTQGLTKALERLQNPAPRGKTRRDENRARPRAGSGAGHG